LTAKIEYNYRKIRFSDEISLRDAVVVVVVPRTYSIILGNLTASAIRPARIIAERIINAILRLFIYLNSFIIFIKNVKRFIIHLRFFLFYLFINFSWFSRLFIYFVKNYRWFNRNNRCSRSVQVN